MPPQRAGPDVKHIAFAVAKVEYDAKARQDLSCCLVHNAMNHGGDVRKPVCAYEIREYVNEGRAIHPSIHPSAYVSARSNAKNKHTDAPTK